MNISVFSITSFQGKANQTTTFKTKNAKRSIQDTCHVLKTSYHLKDKYDHKEMIVANR